MTVVIKQRRLARLPTAPSVRVNSAHFAAPSLEFAYLGHPAVPPRNRALRGREEMTALAGTTYGVSIDGWGVSADAADRGYYAVARNPSAFAGDVTLLWRGVIVGAPGGTNAGCIFGVRYGNATAVPYEVLSISRVQSNADQLQVISNGGGNYTLFNASVGLSSLYGRRVTIAVSSVAGVNSADVVIAADDAVVTAFSSAFSFGPGPANPRLTSASDRIQIGENLGAGRFPNTICTAAALWSRALSMAQLVELATHSADIFDQPRVVIPFDSAAPPPPPPPPPPSGPFPFKRKSMVGGMQDLRGLIIR